MRGSIAASTVALLLGVTACQRMGTATPYVVVGETSAAVKATFNADVGKVRVVMIVSPT